MSKIKTYGKIKYKINNTNTTFKLDVVKELDPYELEIAEKLHPSYISAMKEAYDFLKAL